VQVSDQRLTRTWLERRGGLLYERCRHVDQRNKTLVVECADGGFSIAYTELARIGEEGPDDWLAEHLTSIDAPQRGVRFICASVEGHATRSLSNLRRTVNRRERRLSIVFTVAKPDARKAHATSIIHGAEAAVERHVEQRLKKLRSELPFGNEEEVAWKLVALLRAVGKHPKHGHLIGRDCLSVSPNLVDPLAPKKGRMVVTYHPDKASPYYLTPHLFTRSGNLESGWVQGNPPLPWNPRFLIEDRSEGL
jgi:hypothetical protein